MNLLGKVVVGLLALLTLCSPGRAGRRQVDRPSPLFAGKAIPETPQQRQRWQAPAGKVPDRFIKLNEELFKVGFADPRGCEYRVISVTIGSVWTGDAGTFETRGWVLPADARSPHRFAVCWNALVYPVVKVGPPADLAADVKAAARAARAKKPHYSEDAYPQASEGWSVWHKSLLARHPLLLRLGEVGLFLEDFGGEADQEPALDPAVVSWGSEWAWTLFERGICAQMRGDDVLALESYRLLAKARPLIEARLPKPGKEERAREQGLLDFLRQLPGLLADQERRVQKPRQFADIVCIGPGKHPDAQKRIAALIERLDEVSARQQGQPGGVSIGSDPIVQALIREGEPALGPLLDCLEKDERFTRSVHFWRDFARSRTVLSVQEATYTALTAILQTGGFEPAATGDNLTSRGPRTRKELADHFRKYRKKLGGLPTAERYFRVLADDRAKPEAWAHAASVLMEREDVAHAGGSMVWSGATVRTKPKSDKIVAESLRGRRNPSLTDLLVKRVGQSGELELATHLALQLAKWDRKAALPIVKEQMKRSRKGGKDAFFLDLVNACGGDQAALDEYADWLRALKRPDPDRDSRFHWGNTLYPLRTYYRHPRLAEASDWLFNDPSSPWVPYLKPQERGGASYLTDLYEFGFVGIPAVRKAFLRDLADRKHLGTTEYDSRGRRSYDIPGITNSYETGYPWRDVSLPAQGVKGRFRVCDWVAYKMSEYFDGAPRCELWWPEEKRDRAVAACKAFLEKYGERLGHEYQRLTFPTRGRPATEEEARRGAAVFSLPGKVRALPWEFPIEATWTVLKDNPYQVKERKGGKAVTHLTYWNKGRVWQAEEVLEGGRWKRYYGFVGSHRIERVPAEEIAFPPPNGPRWAQAQDTWTELAPGLHGRLRGWWKDEDLHEGGDARRAAGEALPIVVELWNARGLDQPVAGLEKLLKLRVEYSPETVSRQGFLAPTGAWRPLVARRTTPWKGLPAVLPTGQIVPLAAVDVRDGIDLAERGYYRVSLGTASLRFSLGPEAKKK
jgi:hypothetical protein